MLKITILAENLVRQRGLLAEHGLSLWIENDNGHDVESLLFDTGQTDVYLRNAKALGIDLAKAQAIVISHGHYDHGGGLAFFPQEARWPSVYIHPDALLPKYDEAKPLDEHRRIVGLPWHTEDLPHLADHLLLNTSTMQVSPNMSVLANIPKTVEFEAVAYLEKNGQPPQDPLHNEQLMVVSQPQGLVVILGCSHPGVINCLQYVQQVFSNQPIHTIIGGMHLERADPQRLRLTIDYLRSLGVEQIVPLHCTGQGVIWMLKKELGDKVLIRCTGESIEI